MTQALLLQRERLGLNAVVHTTLQVALERGVGDDQVPALLAEIRVALDNAINHIASELGIPPPGSSPLAVQAPVAQAPAAQRATAPATAPVSYPEITPPPAPTVYPLTPVSTTVSTREPASTTVSTHERLPARPPPPPAHQSIPRPRTPIGPRHDRANAPGSTGSRRIIIKRGPLKVSGAAASLPDEVLLNIFNRLLPPAHSPFQRGGRFVLLMKASHVCRDWRRTALSNPSLWTRLACLSYAEILNFRELIYRSYPLPLDIDLDLAIAQKYKNQTIFVPLAGEMQRVRTLKLALQPSHTLAWNALQDALMRPAPLLRSFELEFTPGYLLPDALFGGHAPALTWLACDPAVLPNAPMPDALGAVTSFDARSWQGASLREALARRLFMACPQLKTLFLAAPVSDAGELMSAPAAGRVPEPDSVGRFYSRSRNLDHLELARVAPEPAGKDVVPTLHLFNHKHIAYIHVRGADVLLFEFMRRRIGPVHNLSIVGDARLALRDDKKYERVFSDTPPPMLLQMLQQHGLYGALQSITLWALVSEPALHIVQGMRLPELRKLSILIRPGPASAAVPRDIVHVFDALRRSPWDLPRLRTLRFTAEDVSGAFPFAAGCRPAVAARAVRDFVRDGLRVGFWDRRLQEVVLDGVSFVEHMRSYDVEALRDVVQDIAVY